MNILQFKRFKRCSKLVKVRLFRSFCVCFDDTALWCNYSVGAISRLASCYNKCLKYFFGYSKYSSVTDMLLEVGLPSFNTTIMLVLLTGCQRATMFLFNVFCS